MSDHHVDATIPLATPRIHYVPIQRVGSDSWKWPVDNSPILACEYQPRLAPLYQYTAKRLTHSLREHTKTLDDVTCRGCRRSEDFQEDRHNREDRNNAVPRLWHYYTSKKQRARARNESIAQRVARYAAYTARLAAEETAKTSPVVMWRTRAARQQPCPCPMHTKAHDKRVAASLPDDEDE